MLRTPFHDDAVVSAAPAVHRGPHSPPPHSRHPAAHHHQEYFYHHHRTLPDLGQLAVAATESARFEGHRALPGSRDSCFDDAALIRAAQRRGHWMEREHRPSIGLFHNNRDILPTMRCKLINWLIEVSLHFRLHKETLYLAIHYIDRFLSLHWGIHRSRLQLIGIASLFIAAKLEVLRGLGVCRTDPGRRLGNLPTQAPRVCRGLRWRMHHA